MSTTRMSLIGRGSSPYAIAKIAGLKMCEAHNRQYGSHFISVMPTNLYGPEDNFDRWGGRRASASRRGYDPRTSGT
jgi:GDP-L-fucose synthase